MKIKLILLSFLIVVSLSANILNINSNSKFGKINIVSEKTLSVGNNYLIFNLKQIKNIDNNTKIKVKIFMPAMPGMPAMKYETIAKPIGDLKFRSNINIPMGGTWQIYIFITLNNGKKIRFKSSFNL